MVRLRRSSISMGGGWQWGTILSRSSLFDPAKPGDKILVAVKLLHTVDQKHFTGADLRIDFPSTRPNPTQLFQEMGSVSILAPYAGAASQKLQAELAKVCRCSGFGRFGAI